LKKILSRCLPVFLLLAPVLSSVRAATIVEIVAAAKKESEFNFIAGAQTFGGKKAMAEIEEAFNKKYGLKARINFAAGPDMNAMAARVITEAKSGNRSSTDFYLGSHSHYALLHQQNALEKVDWSGTFPWIKKEMEIYPREGVLVYTSLRGMSYNSTLIPKDKAPKRYEDLVDPRFSPAWAGKLAIPPYVSWLVEMSMIWSEEKVKDFARKLIPMSVGRLRYNEEERIVSGEFAISANMGGAVEQMWKWQAKGAPLVAVPGSTPVLPSYFQLGVPRSSAHPNLAKLFVAFLASKEGQALLEKHEFVSSHLVEGTKMARYVKESGIKLQEAKDSIAFYLKGEDSGLQLKEELAKMLKL